MDKAAADEKKRKTASISEAAESRKRPSSASNEQASDPKRPKLEPDTTATTSASFLAAFDFTSLPASLITDLIVANLEAFTEPALIGLVQAYRQSRGLSAPLPVPDTSTAPAALIVPAPPLERERTHTPLAQPVASVSVPLPVKDEPLDPLQMDIDQDEIEYEPDRLNMEVCVRCIFA
jgi:symplekin